MEGAKEEEARVSMEALSGGGEAGWGLLRGWARVWRGTCMPSMPPLPDGESEVGDGMVVGEEGIWDAANEVWLSRAEDEPGGESDPPECEVGSGVAPVPGTTAIRFAPPPESIERSVVGFVDA